MTKSKFLSLLGGSGPPLLSDGAMGTMLNARGVGFDQCFDELNLSQPALVAEVHRAYIDAGSAIIQTNTFGANRYKLAVHGLEDKVVAINQAGVELARRVVAASFKDVLVAGDIGPRGCGWRLLAACSLKGPARCSPNRSRPWQGRAWIC